jgi:hypothetical protein
MKDGVIKFNLRWREDRAPENVDDLLLWRDKLCEAALIGVHADGIGYGNISARSGRGFVISGSGTGRHTTSRREHFTRVTGYDFQANTVTCRGPVEASSESLTHAAIYEADPAVAAVVHVHHKRLWKELLGTVPTTSAEIAYGTPEMAYEIFRLFRQTEVATDKLFAMGGHEDGIVSFGGTLAEAGQRLLGLLQREHRT